MRLLQRRIFFAAAAAYKILFLRDWYPCRLAAFLAT
jgi:hypothetical protein